MESRTARTDFKKPKMLVFNHLGYRHGSNQICSFWLAGRCNRNPCRFLHPDSVSPHQHPQPQQQSNPQRQRQPEQSHSVSSDDHCGKKLKSTWRNPNFSSSKIVMDSSAEGVYSEGKVVHVIKNHDLKLEGDSVGEIFQKAQQKKFESTWRNPNFSSSKIVVASSSKGVDSDGKIVHVIKNQDLKLEGVSVGGICQKAQQKLCQYWATGNCVHGDNCSYLHSWFFGSGFSPLAKLEVHSKSVTGIALPPGSDKLFSGSKDESVCVWDCHSGQCISTVKLGSEIGCLICEGPWVFVGLQNAVKAWNIESQTELLLSGPNGLVRAMVVGGDILFGGVQDGSILAWKSTSESNCPEVVAVLKGHKLAVLCLAVGADWLYSGSKDETIRVWDMKTLQCLHTLNGHSSFVTAVLCWDRYLLSGSLDNTLKMWALNGNGNLEVVSEVKEESGILALCGITDADAKPILLCSRKDNTVYLYDLPSFTERGRIFAKTEVETIEIGCGGLFFTGEASGQLSVWKLLGEPSEGAESHERSSVEIDPCKISE